MTILGVDLRLFGAFYAVFMALPGGLSQMAHESSASGRTLQRTVFADNRALGVADTCTEGFRGLTGVVDFAVVSGKVHFLRALRGPRIA